MLHQISLRKHKMDFPMCVHLWIFPDNTEISDAFLKDLKKVFYEEDNSCYENANLPVGFVYKRILVRYLWFFSGDCFVFFS